MNKILDNLLFRGWNGEKWVFSRSIINEEGLVLLSANDGTGAMISVDPLSVSQWTGQTDWKGVKIFENDIVQNDSDWITETPGGPKAGFIVKKGKKPRHVHIGVIEWENETCGFIMGPYRCICRTDSNIIEVIGSVYRNPDIVPVKPKKAACEPM